MTGSSRSTDIRRGLIFDLALGSVTAVGLVVALLFVFMPTRPRPVSSRAPIGVLVDHENQVRRRVAGSLVWDELPSMASLYPRDALYVPPGGFARVKLGDGSDLQIDQRSLVILGEGRPAQPHPGDPAQAAEGGPVLQLVRGAASGQTGPEALALQVGEQAVALKGGTLARVATGEPKSGEVEVTLTQGEATVAGAAVEAGSRVRVASGKARTERLPITLLAPAAGHRQSTGQPVVFRWGARAKGPAPGRVELRGTDGRWRTLGAGEGAWEGAVAPGVYAWRVRGKGGVSEERNLVIEKDVQAEVYRPLASQVVDLSQRPALEVAWSRLPRAQSYRVELSRDATFATTLAAHRAPGPRSSIPRAVFPLEDTYCVRVRGERDQAPLGTWSQPRCFQVILAPLLRAPELFEPSTGDSPAEQGSLLRWLLPVAHAQGSPEDATRPRPVSLRWEAVSGAVSYEIEIANDAGFTRTVVRERVTQPVFRFAPKQQGVFYWRVRGIDQAGRLGQVSAARRLVLKVEVPALLEPRDGAYVLYRSGPPRVTLRWGPVSEAKGYVVEVSRTASFASPVRLSSTEPSTVHRPPELGPLYWRVAAVTADGLQSAFSAPREIQVVPASPALQSPPSGASLPNLSQPVELTWSPRPVARYVIEIAPTPDFAAPIRSERVTARRFSHTFTQRGTYYWRVRGEGPPTGWSEVRSLEVAVSADPGTAADGKGAAGGQEPQPPRVERTAGGDEPGAGQLSVAGRVGYLTNFTRVHAPRLDVALGYRVPIGAAELYVAASVGYHTMAEHVAAGPLNVGAHLHVLPMLVQVRWVVPSAWLGGFNFATLSLVGAAGFWLGITTLQGTAVAPATFTQAGLAAALGLAVEKQLGVGRLFVALDAFLGSPSGGLVAYDPMAMVLAVGYRVFLW